MYFLAQKLLLVLNFKRN